MDQRRTVDLLPEIFRTPTNRKFLSATLDQLTQEPQIQRTRGYVGRRIGPGVDPQDNYVREPDATRADYQLEPGVIFLSPDTNRAEDAITYPGMIDSLQLQGADTARQDRLFQSEYYTWDPFCDLDKFTNYSQYYWLPEGPDSVDVSSTVVPLTDDFEVSRSQDTYSFSGINGSNPVITLARGGSYRFQVAQTGNPFWIQVSPGINGRLPTRPNISSRDVMGVLNNGEDLGTVTFNVPLKNAQDFYYQLADIGSVDLASDLRVIDINNRYVDDFLAEYPQGIDGITNLDGRTVIFLNKIVSASAGGWQITTLFDPLIRTAPNQVGANVSFDVNGQPYDDVPYNTITDVILSGSPDSSDSLPGSFDSIPFDQTTDITNQNTRYSIWRIQYIQGGDGRFYMQLTSVLPVPLLSKTTIGFGTTYSGVQFYRDASGFFERIPLLSAIQDTLYYQDGVNPEIFGEIRLIDPNAVQPVLVDEIIGASNYTSPNGVVFTNGLKVQFRGPTTPAQFQDQEYYVEGVGTGPGLFQRVGFVDGEAYFGPFHVHNGQKMTGAVHQDSFHQNIYDTVAESLANIGAGGPPGSLPSLASTPNATLGNGIRLVPVRELVTPETYTRSLDLPYDSTSYDSTPWDGALNAPLVSDYLTINRSSRDRNPWSRSNRWFHIDVIRYSAERNNTTPVLDNQARGRRPIIEFRANLGLYNFGTQGKLPVNIIDFNATDALSNINGTTGYGIDGYTLIEGSRVIFAADINRDVRNRIYTVQFIDPDGNPNSPRIINLVPAEDGEALLGQTVVSLSGITQQGLSFWYDGADWRASQQKTGVNQAPLFDVYDAQGRSFADNRFYPSTTFAGSRLFGYALGGTQISDTVLGFVVKFLNINNVGDIVFENYFYTDQFIYVANGEGTEVDVSSGFVRQYKDRVSFSELIGWLPAAAESRSRQIFRFVNNVGLLVLDVPVVQESVYPPVQIFVDGQFIEPENYSVSIEGNNTFISLFVPIPSDSVIEASVLSDVPSVAGFYEVPVNLENNALNQNSPEFTLGTIRTHYETIGQNLQTIQGPIVGANNSRDLGEISRYGQNIIQHSSPLTLTGVFLRETQFEIAQALKFNSQEYEKYKARLIGLAAQGDFVNLTPTQVLDATMQEISLTRNENSPFYWSDMIPAGETYQETRVTYSIISTPTFDTTEVYDFTSSNFKSLLLFVNGRILTRGREYTVGQGVPTVTVTIPLSVGDEILIREYATTFGSFVPNTPTKMGLYPAFVPEIYLDESYVTPRTVIRGHDGSITVAYGDARDEVLLEFETRIYNNLKIASSVPLDTTEVVPGQWRTTDYSLAEVNQILDEDFLSWVGWNKIDYTTQDFVQDNAFTYNYSQSSDRVSGNALLGAWRGIYQFFYDTIAPNTRPWEMLGMSEKPSWWETTYGPAPYTSGNLVLWQDLALGLVRDPMGEYILPQYRRPQLLQVIPADSEGGLLSPLDSVVGNFDANSFRRSWTFGDGGPAESAWRTSSAWPFAAMRLLALTKPAKFFSLFVDRDRYRFDDDVLQFLWNDRYRLDAKNLAPLYGDGVSRASYINWIIDYNRQLGVDSTERLERRLSNIDLRLCWRTAAFTDKRLLKIFTERSTPTSLNTSLLLPDESYALLLYQNPAFESFQYSSVIVQKDANGWSVFGYSATQPYFNIVASRINAKTITLSAGDTAVNVATQHADNVVRVPYGYVFRNRAAVCDFLISYGTLLQRQGMKFEGMENGYVMDWTQMAQEFLYWSTQGWVDGSMINLNPASTRISITRDGAVAESLSPPRLDNIILNQNRQAIAPIDLVIDRMDNTITLEVTAEGNDTINFFGLRFTAFEHMVVLDNRSIFSDLIYDPATGARQSRVLVAGALSSGWNGTVNAPGFVLNQDNIQEWSTKRGYTKGEIVRFKDDLWTASTIIQPSQSFDYSLWLRSDYDEVQRGLLPNAASVSDQLATAYSVYNANLDSEVDLFSYGLIGFRPRRYMAALNLDDVSQINLYQQFLGTKGTRSAVEIFSLADLGKELAEYDLYEYWAIRRGQYGANANRSYFEVLLDAPLLTSNPSIIEIIQSGQTSQADQQVLLQNLWNTSYRITSTDILPETSEFDQDRALPSAGYVNFNDVNFATFDLDSLTQSDIASIGVGSTIWVAAVGAYEWNVYRVENVGPAIVSVTDNLDGTSLVTFDGVHNLSRDDRLLIRFFTPAIDGSYLVLTTPSIFTLTISYQFEGLQTTELGTGLALRLRSARVSQASDAVLQPSNRVLPPRSLIWVDRTPQGTWAVIEKTQPFQESQDLRVQFPVEDAQFGASVSQGFFNLSALIGAPGYNPASSATVPGAVYSFVRSDQDRYEFNSILELGAADTEGYGNDIDIGNQQWAIIGASASNNDQGYAAVIYRQPGSSGFEQRRLLTAGDGEFGSTQFGKSVTISANERWILIGAPGEAASQIGGAVYVYGRVDVQPQSVQYVTDGATLTYTYGGDIVITNVAAWQLVVVLNNVLLTPGVDYSINSQNITLQTVPLAGLVLTISRRTGAQLDQQVYRNVTQSTATGAGTGAVFLVNRVRGVYTTELLSGGSGYVPGDVLTVNATEIGGGVNGVNDLVITVVADDSGAITAYTQSGSGVSDTDIFDLSYYFAQFNDIWSCSVRVDGVLQRPNLDYEINSIGDLEFITLPAPGANILVDAQSYFQYVDKITVPGLASGTQFGESVTITTDGQNFIVGAPGAAAEQGKSYVFTRTSESFQVTVPGAATFTTQNMLQSPVSVQVNGEFLLNTELNIGGEYTVTGADTVSISRNLAVGDIVEIDTNSFELVQIIDSQRPYQSARFGEVVDQCINDCSLYIASPLDGAVKPQAGSVELWQNQSRLYGVITSEIANPVLTPGDFVSVNGFLVECTGTTVAELKDDINNAKVPNARATTSTDLEFVADGLTRVFDVGTIYSDTVYVGAPTTKVLVDEVLQTAGVDYVYDNSAQTITFTSAPIENSVIDVISGRLVITAANVAAAPAFNRLNVRPAIGSLYADLGLMAYVGQQIIESPVPQDFARFGSSVFISDDVVTLAIGAPGGSTILDTTFDQNTTQFDAASTQFKDPVQQSGAVYVYNFLPAYQASVSNPGQFIFGQQMTPENLRSLDQFGSAVDLTTGVLLMGAPGNDLDDSQLNFGNVFQFENRQNLPAWQVRRAQTPSVNINLLNTSYIFDYDRNSAATYLDYFDPSQGRLLGAVAQNLDYIGAVDPASYNVGPVNNRGSRWGEESVGRTWWDTNAVRFVDANQGDLAYASNQWGQVFPGSRVEIYQWISSSTPPQVYSGPGQVRNIDSYVLVPTVNAQGIFQDVYYFWITNITQIGAGKTLSVDTLTRYILDPRASGIAYLAPLATNVVALYNCEDTIAQGNSVLHVEFDRVANDSLVHVEFELVAQDRPAAFLDNQLYTKLLDSFCGVDTTGAAVPDPFLSPAERLGTSIRPRQSMFADRFAALQNYLTAANTVISQFPVTETRSFRLLNSRDPEPSQASGQWNQRLADDQELSFQDLSQVPIGYKYLVSSDARNRGLWSIYEVIALDSVNNRDLLLVRVQNYDTRLYWQRINWYRTGFDPLTRILLEVPVTSALTTLQVPEGSTVKVLANGQGLWEIYQLTAGAWQRVALQNGTIEFSQTLYNYQLGRFGFDAEVFDSQYFDQEPVIETRRILEAINQDLLIDELLLERNRLLILMFNYILSEQISPDWLTKTSLVDVDHTIRELQPFQTYRQDNQDFVLEYINEVKPYHTQIREFGLIYRGQDLYQGTLTDFDLPAYWDAAQGRFISPVLDNTGTVSTTSSTPSDSAIWQEFPWNQWFQNYLLSIESATVISGGSGYQVPPQVEVTGTAQRPAIMTARINSAGQVVAIDIQDPGAGYSTTAILTLVGGVPEGTAWQPNTAVFSGAVLVTDRRDVYRVITSGITGAVPPTDTSVLPAVIPDGTVQLNYVGTQAVAVANMGNGLIRNIITTIKYDRYQYNSDILPWQPGRVYIDGDRVRYIDRVWEASAGDSGGFSSQDFDPSQWTEIPAGQLSGVDRTMGYYAPGPDQPGLDLAQLISGVDYPGVQVSAPGFDQNTGFDVGNYDVNPFDNISFGPEGLPTYDPAILDAVYESEFTDPYLGTLPAPAYAGDPPTTGPANAITVAGGAFVDTYSSHAPEELVPGAMFDTLDLRVYTTPGADWQGDGHGFPVASRRYDLFVLGETLSYADLLSYPVAITVFNATTNTLLYPSLQYIVDWVAQTVTINDGATSGSVIVISVAALGGGNQIFSQSYSGPIPGSELVIPRQFSLIQDIVIFVNGSQITSFSWEALGQFDTMIQFQTLFTDTDQITVTVFGTTSTVSTPSWSLPVNQTIITTASLTYTLTNNLSGTNPVDLVVTVNGRRARPYNNLVYIANGSSTVFDLPDVTDVPPDTIANNDVAVFVDNTALILGIGFVVEPSDGSSARQVSLTQAPSAGSRVLVSVRTGAQYRVVGNQLTLLPQAGLSPPTGSIMTVTTFNNTSQQDIMTRVYVGPESQGLQITQAYDTTLYDQGSISGESGSFDFSTGTVISVNRFDIGRPIVNTDRLLVTLNGAFLFNDRDYTVRGSEILLPGAPISPSSVLAITSYTNSVVPGVIAFRIFQDMRGLQSLYRITSQTSTVLVSPLTTNGDTILVSNAANLDEPDLSQGRFGIVTINGERIAYRVRDVVNNLITGLRRGTAGTAANNHAAGSSVLSMGSGNLLPREYQRNILQEHFLANGIDTVFVAPDINLADIDSTELVEAVKVYVGGIRQLTGFLVTSGAPVTIEFAQAPPAGYQVTVLVEQAQVMYQQGIGTASDGQALQETDTAAARFIRGL